MADVLIRDVPDDALQAIDAKAKRLGVSRAEYLRRALLREGATGEVSVTDLSRFATTFGDLLDDQVMAEAWD